MNLRLESGLTVRDCREADSNAFFELMSLPQTQRFLPDRFESAEEMAEVIGWLRGNYGRPDFMRLTYAVADGERLVGWVSVGPLPSDESKRELAYCVHPDYWGRGVATEAAGAFLSWLAREGVAGPLFAEAHLENAPSGRVLEKLGFKTLGDFAEGETGASKRLYGRTTS